MIGIKNILFIIFLFLFCLPIVKADVGVGLRWGSEELFLNEFEEKCISYSVYNPFDTGVTAQLTTERGIEKYISKIEPKQVYLPPYTGDPKDVSAKLANKQDVRVCFKANPFRWPPFYPVNYEGVVLAMATPGKVVGTGSAAASVVQAPLTLRIGNIVNFYKFLIILVVIIILVLLLILKIKKKLPKPKRKYCSKCKKSYPFKIKYCPNCGRELK